MSREFFSQLTTKDVSILTTILERYEDLADAFATLLREKLSHATIYFRDDIPGDAVTLNSRVTYRINGRIMPSQSIPSVGSVCWDWQRKRPRWNRAANATLFLSKLSNFNQRGT
jgi:hypothetical protein